MDSDGSEKTYRTKDLGEASALLTVGLNLLRLDKDSSFSWFVFEDNDSKKLSNNYWNGQLTVSAKSFNDSLRTLKDRLFSQNSR